MCTSYVQLAKWKQICLLVLCAVPVKRGHVQASGSAYAIHAWLLCGWVAYMAGVVSALKCRHDTQRTMILSVPAASAALKGLDCRRFGLDLLISAWLLRSWAAYVAGALVVLMRERGMRFADGFSILISSAVPEGKGVSSSAAVEVATMQALTAAQGLALDGRDLALLCQKVKS